MEMKLLDDSELMTGADRRSNAYNGESAAGAADDDALPYAN